MANADALMAKAQRAADSAGLLLMRGDIDGACNRAYYAMFDAARAALLSSGMDLLHIRTHGGLIAEFGKQLVKSGKIERRWGHALNRAHEIRLIADYTGDMVDRELATWVVDQSREFIEALRRT